MVKSYKVKLTRLQQEIVRLLFLTAGEKLNQNAIARRLGVSQPAVVKAIPVLKKDDLIKLEQDKESKRWAIELNWDNRRLMQIKRADNLRQIYESGLSDFLEKEFAGATVILFGSYSRGDDRIGSDIDIAIVGRKEKNVSLGDFEEVLGRKININFYGSFGKIHKNLRENLFNGILLSGGISL